MDLPRPKSRIVPRSDGPDPLINHAYSGSPSPGGSVGRATSQARSAMSLGSPSPRRADADAALVQVLKHELRGIKDAFGVHDTTQHQPHPAPGAGVGPGASSPQQTPQVAQVLFQRISELEFDNARLRAAVLVPPSPPTAGGGGVRYAAPPQAAQGPHACAISPAKTLLTKPPPPRSGATPPPYQSPSRRLDLGLDPNTVEVDDATPAVEADRAAARSASIPPPAFTLLTEPAVPATMQAAPAAGGAQRTTPTKIISHPDAQVWADAGEDKDTAAAHVRLQRSACGATSDAAADGDTVAGDSVGDHSGRGGDGHRSRCWDASAIRSPSDADPADAAVDVSGGSGCGSSVASPGPLGDGAALKAVHVWRDVFDLLTRASGTTRAAAVERISSMARDDERVCGVYEEPWDGSNADNEVANATLASSDSSSYLGGSSSGGARGGTVGGNGVLPASGNAGGGGVLPESLLQLRSNILTQLAQRTQQRDGGAVPPAGHADAPFDTVREHGWGPCGALLDPASEDNELPLAHPPARHLADDSGPEHGHGEGDGAGSPGNKIPAGPTTANPASSADCDEDSFLMHERACTVVPDASETAHTGKSEGAHAVPDVCPQEDAANAFGLGESGGQKCVAVAAGADAIVNVKSSTCDAPLSVEGARCQRAAGRTAPRIVTVGGASGRAGSLGRVSTTQSQSSQQAPMSVVPQHGTECNPAPFGSTTAAHVTALVDAAGAQQRRETARKRHPSPVQALRERIMGPGSAAFCMLPSGVVVSSGDRDADAHTDADVDAGAEQNSSSNVTADDVMRARSGGVLVDAPSHCSPSLLGSTTGVLLPVAGDGEEGGGEGVDAGVVSSTALRDEHQSQLPSPPVDLSGLLRLRASVGGYGISDTADPSPRGGGVDPSPGTASPRRAVTPLGSAQSLKQQHPQIPSRRISPSRPPRCGAAVASGLPTEACLLPAAPQSATPPRITAAGAVDDAASASSVEAEEYISSPQQPAPACSETGAAEARGGVDGDAGDGTAACVPAGDGNSDGDGDGVCLYPPGEGHDITPAWHDVSDIAHNAAAVDAESLQEDISGLGLADTTLAPDAAASLRGKGCAPAGGTPPEALLAREGTPHDSRRHDGDASCLLDHSLLSVRTAERSAVLVDLCEDSPVEAARLPKTSRSPNVRQTASTARPAYLQDTCSHRRLGEGGETAAEGNVHGSEQHRVMHAGSTILQNVRSSLPTRLFEDDPPCDDAGASAHGVSPSAGIPRHLIEDDDFCDDGGPGSAGDAPAVPGSSSDDATAPATSQAALEGVLARLFGVGVAGNAAVECSVEDVAGRISAFPTLPAPPVSAAAPVALPAADEHCDDHCGRGGRQEASAVPATDASAKDEVMQYVSGSTDHDEARGSDAGTSLCDVTGSATSPPVSASPGVVNAAQDEKTGETAAVMQEAPPTHSTNSVAALEGVLSRLFGGGDVAEVPDEAVAAHAVGDASPPPASEDMVPAASQPSPYTRCPTDVASLSPSPCVSQSPTTTPPQGGRQRGEGRGASSVVGNPQLPDVSSASCPTPREGIITTPDAVAAYPALPQPLLAQELWVPRGTYPAVPAASIVRPGVPRPSPAVQQLTSVLESGNLFKYEHNGVLGLYNRSPEKQYTLSFVFSSHDVAPVPGGDCVQQGRAFVVKLAPGETKPLVRGRVDGYKVTVKCGRPSWQRLVREVDAQERMVQKAMETARVRTLRDCVDQKVLFIDRDFPPTAASLSRAWEARTTPRAWHRPGDLLARYAPAQTLPPNSAPHDSVDTPVHTSVSTGLFVTEVRPNTIRLGAFTDVPFASALAVLAETPGLVHAMFSHRQYPDVGAYKVRLYLGGREKCVLVDSYIPHLAYAPAFASHLEHPGELWVSLAQKAFAKVHGSYMGARGCGVGKALQVLSGFPLTTLSLAGGPGDVHAYNTFETLKSGVQGGSVVWVETPPAAGVGGPLSSGLLPQCGYAVIQARESHGRRMLQVRNPWLPTKQWTGRWCNTSCHWDENPGVTQDLHMCFEHDGCFWLEWDEARRAFASAGILSRSKLYCVSAPIAFTCEQPDCVVRLTLEHAVDLSVSAMQLLTRDSSQAWEHPQLKAIIYSEGGGERRGVWRGVDATDATVSISAGTHWVAAHLAPREVREGAGGCPAEGPEACTGTVHLTLSTPHRAGEVAYFAPSRELLAELGEAGVGGPSHALDACVFDRCTRTPVHRDVQLRTPQHAAVANYTHTAAL